MKQKLSLEDKTNLEKIQFNDFDQMSFHEQQKRAVMYDFECKTMLLHHRKCLQCRRITLNHDKFNKTENLCQHCTEDDSKDKFCLRNNTIPIWVDDNDDVHYDQPTELKDLSVAEQLLIQRLSPYVPIVHLKNGVFGIKGSCCAFRQDIKQVYNELPRQRVELVKYIKCYSSLNNEIHNTKILTVRKSKVLDALHFLKRHHKYYRDITINEDNLSWMGDKEEAQLDNCVEIKKNVNHKTNDKPDDSTSDAHSESYESEDTDTDDTDDEDVEEYSDVEENEAYNLSVSHLQRDMAKEEYQNDVEYMGALGDNEAMVNNPEARRQLQDLKDTYNQHTTENNRNHMLQWPSVAREAENEFNGEPIFVNAFPWLFPGGIADVKEPDREKNVQPTDWANYLLHYYDGRFAKDKLWCFYIQNYVERHRNQSNGSFFVKNFNKYNCPTDLESLKQELREGKTDFIDKLQYFSTKLTGSDAYWRSQRYQVSTWIHHHMEMGNGPPSIFLTLSCAEYYWPDLIRLLEERIKMDNPAGECPDLKNDKSAMIKAANDYSIVVQEYFIQRVQIWMDTVGKKLFKIKHYWYRYEFAKGRGQIHAHMLCICDNQHIMREAYRAREDKDKQVEILANYMRDTFNLTAMHPGITVDNNVINYDQVGPPEGTAPRVPYAEEPATMYCRNIVDDRKDKINAVNASQMHDCNCFCLRCTRKKDVYYCRSGCGETDKETGKTKGFEIRHTDIIQVDKKGIHRLQLKRNSKRMMQTSMDALQSWRANCDVQIILYDSNPRRPNYLAIGQVVDYVASYCCKGNATQRTEKRLHQDLINSTDSTTYNNAELVRMTRRLLNRANNSRTISKQECMVLLSDLPLICCSEIIDKVSISDSEKLKNKKNTNKRPAGFLGKYVDRPEEDEHYSLFRYFHKLKNPEGNPNHKTIIPHFTGCKINPVFPVTKTYMKSILLIYKKFHSLEEIYTMTDDQIKQEFEQFVNNTKSDTNPDGCPVRVATEYAEAVARYNNGTDFVDFTEYDPGYLEHLEQLAEEDQNLLTLMNSLSATAQHFIETYGEKFDRGLEFDWGKKTKPVSTYMYFCFIVH